MRAVRFVACAVFLSLSAQASSPGHEEETSEALEEVPAKQSSRDVKLPGALVARIDREYREFLKSQKISEKTEIKRKLLNISVELTQKRRAALQNNVRIITPLGGGVIDLEDFITPLRGAFQAKIIAEKEKGHAPDDLRFFYISNAKARIIAGDEYGAGCDRFMEVTSFMTKQASLGGLDLYTADQRYLSVLGGTFLMTAFDKDALYVGGVTFTDGRYPGQMCEDR